MSWTRTYRLCYPHEIRVVLDTGYNVGDNGKRVKVQSPDRYPYQKRIKQTRSKIANPLQNCSLLRAFDAYLSSTAVLFRSVYVYYLEYHAREW